MLKTKFESLVDFLEMEIPLFDGNGYYLEANKKHKTGFEGITDTIDSYFFLTLSPSLTPAEYNFTPVETEGADFFTVSANVILLVSVKNPDKYNIVQAFTSALSKYGQLSVNINTISTDSRNIY